MNGLLNYSSMGHCLALNEGDVEVFIFIWDSREKCNDEYIEQSVRMPSDARTMSAGNF